MLVELEISRPGATPVPASDATTLPLEELLDIVTVPLTLPADDGVKTTLNVALWPAETATGRLGDVSENCGVLNVAPVTVTEAFPLFVAVTVNVLLFPTTTLPKLKLEPVNPKSPVGVGC
jgi:hypothetical protein